MCTHQGLGLNLDSRSADSSETEVSPTPRVSVARSSTPPVEFLGPHPGLLSCIALRVSAVPNTGADQTLAPARHFSQPHLLTCCTCSCFQCLSACPDANLWSDWIASSERSRHSPRVNLANRMQRSSRLTWPLDDGLRNNRNGTKHKSFHARVPITTPCARLRVVLPNMFLEPPTQMARTHLHHPESQVKQLLQIDDIQHIPWAVRNDLWNCGSSTASCRALGVTRLRSQPLVHAGWHRALHTH